MDLGECAGQAYIVKKKKNAPTSDPVSVWPSPKPCCLDEPSAINHNLNPSSCTEKMS